MNTTASDIKNTFRNLTEASPVTPLRQAAAAGKRSARGGTCCRLSLMRGILSRRQWTDPTRCPGFPVRFGSGPGIAVKYRFAGRGLAWKAPTRN